MVSGGSTRRSSAYTRCGLSGCASSSASPSRRACRCARSASASCRHAASAQAAPSRPSASQERLTRLARIGLDADGHRIVATDVTALDVDLDDRRLRADVAIVEVRGELRQARADGQEHVGPPARRRGFGRAGATERADVERVRVRHGVVAPVGGDHRDRRSCSAQPHDQIAGARAVDAAADEQQRALGLAQEPRRPRGWRRDAAAGGG